MKKVSVQLTPSQVEAILDCFASSIEIENIDTPRNDKSPAEIAAWWKSTGRKKAKGRRDTVRICDEAAAVIEALDSPATVIEDAALLRDQVEMLEMQNQIFLKLISELGAKLSDKDRPKTAEDLKRLLRAAA